MVSRIGAVAAEPALQALTLNFPALPPLFHKQTQPGAVSAPHLVVFNTALASSLGLSPETLAQPGSASLFAGNVLPEGADPIAQAYAGHQFGHFTTLGDGRAILLGEQITPAGERFDIQLKGAGLTPYSRGGDGRAALGPMLREYLISEAMHALGIPTTRSLAVVTTGEPVLREKPLPGVSGVTILEEVRAQSAVKCHSTPTMQQARDIVGNAMRPGDLLITLGAGNVHEAGTRLAADLKILEEMRALMPPGEIDGKLYEPMSRHTTLLVGGPAQYWMEPHSFYGFAFLVDYCRERGIPVRVVGRGSNLLVRDGGIRGAVIHPTGGVFSEVTVGSRNEVTAGAGVRLKKLASIAGGSGIGGFEWMEGIPGNVGGALRMNAGAMGIETFDQVVRVTFLDEDGVIRTRERAEIVAQYRNVVELRRNFALQAVFKGKADTAENIKERWDASREKRKATQPVAAGGNFDSAIAGVIGPYLFTHVYSAGIDPARAGVTRFAASAMPRSKIAVQVWAGE